MRRMLLLGLLACLSACATLDPTVVVPTNTPTVTPTDITPSATPTVTLTRERVDNLPPTWTPTAESSASEAQVEVAPVVVDDPDAPTATPTRVRTAVPTITRRPTQTLVPTLTTCGGFSILFELNTASVPYGQDISLFWNPIEGPASYWVRLYNADDDSPRPQHFYDDFPTGASVTIPGFVFPDGGQYRWTVVPLNAERRPVCPEEDAIFFVEGSPPTPTPD